MKLLMRFDLTIRFVVWSTVIVLTLFLLAPQSVDFLLTDVVAVAVTIIYLNVTYGATRAASDAMFPSVSAQSGTSEVALRQRILNRGRAEQFFLFAYGIALLLAESGVSYRARRIDLLEAAAVGDYMHQIDPLFVEPIFQMATQLGIFLLLLGGVVLLVGWCKLGNNRSSRTRLLSHMKVSSSR